MRGLTVALAILLLAGCGDAGLGEACGEINEGTMTDCADGLYCQYHGVGGGRGVCVELSKEGELCLGPTDAPPCAAGLACNAVQQPPTCARPAPQGGECLDNGDCAGGLVCTSTTDVGTCEPPRETGEECFRNDQCAAGLTCLPDATSSLAGRCA